VHDLREFFLINPITLQWRCGGDDPCFKKYFLDYDEFNYILKEYRNINWRKFYDKIF
jgi:hypothetical protein